MIQRVDIGGKTGVIIKMNNYWILESNIGNGWKVVFCKEKPSGGWSNHNWELIKDGLSYNEALKLKRKMVK